MISRWNKRLLVLLVSLVFLYLILLIPDSSPPALEAGGREPFVWNQDEYWSLLETRFKLARSADCADLSPLTLEGFFMLDSLITRLQSDTLAPTAPLFAEIEGRIFELAPLVAVCPDKLRDYVTVFSRLRTAVKNQSSRWDMNSKKARDCVYRLLYGGRQAVEEVMIQSPGEIVSELVLENNEPSVTPSAVIHGVKVHSGDILVSRGGAPTSALIARGNDYPGNFSHVALVHVDDSTGTVSIIESHIERGVVVSSVEDYLKDTKLRIMVLRLRSDLPSIQSDPMLPHKAASYARQKAMTERVAYDFAMDSDDYSKLFCSEVALDAYDQVDVRLWMGISHISSVGVKSWLAAFGVKNFTTQEPSDLEYDPQLRIVAEWRDYETLYKDRLDNAVVDVMLEGAERGDRLGYDWFMLPVARIARAYSVILNQFGEIGPVPEGMSAVAALRNEWFSARHRATKERLLVLARQFRDDNGYSPPYWELIRIARQAYTL